MEVLDAVFNLVQHFFIHPALHVADGDVGVGAFPGVHDFHGQLGVSDAAAYEGGVEDEGLHKAVTGAAQYLVLFRLADASGRVSPAVHGETGVVAVDEEAGDTG